MLSPDRPQPLPSGPDLWTGGQSKSPRPSPARAIQSTWAARTSRRSALACSATGSATTAPRLPSGAPRRVVTAMRGLPGRAPNGAACSGRQWRGHTSAYVSKQSLKAFARNVAAGTDPPTPERREMRALTPDEASALLDAAQAARERARPGRDALHAGCMEAFVTLAVFAGCRRGELLGLKWDDVDLDGGAIVIKRSLIRETRGVPTFGKPKTPPLPPDDPPGAHGPGRPAVASAAPARGTPEARARLRPLRPRLCHPPRDGVQRTEHPALVQGARRGSRPTAGNAHPRPASHLCHAPAGERPGHSDDQHGLGPRTGQHDPERLRPRLARRRTRGGHAPRRGHQVAGVRLIAVKGRQRAGGGSICDLVGERGLEPPTPTSQTWCSTGLSYSPSLLPAKYTELGQLRRRPDTIPATIKSSEALRCCAAWWP